jgi:DNA-binding transcriptional regulator YiaG
MELSQKRCGKCGEQTLKKINVNGVASFPWKDFPAVFITRDLELWTCASCGETAMTRGDAQRTDEAIEGTIRDQTSQFIDIIKSKAGVTGIVLAEMVGVSPTYLSSLHSGKRTPSFQLWNLLKMIAMDPTKMTSMANPHRDIRKETLLLRA